MGNAETGKSRARREPILNPARYRKFYLCTRKARGRGHSHEFVLIGRFVGMAIYDRLEEAFVEVKRFERSDWQLGPRIIVYARPDLAETIAGR